ncbi:MAG: 2,4-dihydroxyhept-2-ene-1,7-dioic acid aldolase [Gammaproteobacteria bacterium]|nr:2,4-dihydroxyhept-2-ene-1,7-dioic acid aldolase [Gammaproteobacteria bacterium]MCG3145231.1 4-hydroxy-2-oxovalerate aldolase [Gammaproteobacteria bacterium]
MFHSFRRRLRARDRLLGTLVSLPSPEVAEILAAVGFDWLFLDGEHGPLDCLTAQRMIQAAGDRCPCLLRIPLADEIEVKKALDIGAAGVIVPQVSTAEQAARVVQWCRYPPAGTRGVGIARAHGYGGYFGEYVQRANEEISVVVQVEHIDAVRNVESIVEVAGIDAVFVGPYDLSASMGLMGEVSHAEVTAAIAIVRDACSRRQMPLGIFGLDPRAIRPHLEQGFSLIAAGCDSAYVHGGGRNTLAQLRILPHTNSAPG